MKLVFLTLTALLFTLITRLGPTHQLPKSRLPAAPLETPLK